MPWIMFKFREYKGGGEEEEWCININNGKSAVGRSTYPFNLKFEGGIVAKEVKTSLMVAFTQSEEQYTQFTL